MEIITLHQPRLVGLNKWMIARLGLVLWLSSIPLLAISGDVFGLVPQQVSALVLLITAAATITLVTVWPHRSDAAIARGAIVGMVACAFYDAVRLFCDYVLGLMGDFIPVMGSRVTGDGISAGSAMVGYLWRYLGDAGGLGIAFYVIALAVGIDRFRPRTVVLTAVVFAVFPVWSGLIATVALAPHGQQMMFPLTLAAVAITFIGHVIFGLILGLLFVRTQCGAHAVQWPWPRLLDLIAAYRGIVQRRLSWIQQSAPLPRPTALA
jgi:hypothetical protein